MAIEPVVGAVESNGAATKAPAPLAVVLTPETAAELLHLTPEAVRRSAEAGELPGRRVAGEWRFATAAVLGWLGERPTSAPSPVPDSGIEWNAETEKECDEFLAQMRRRRQHDEEFYDHEALLAPAPTGDAGGGS